MCQAITWSNADLLAIRAWGAKKIIKLYLKMGNIWIFCIGPNVLIDQSLWSLVMLQPVETPHTGIS